VNEAGHKRSLVKEVNALPGGYARRYEDRFAVGLLDLFIKLPGRAPVWAEAKLITGNVFGPTERQFYEGERMLAAGLRVILIGWKDKQIYLSKWTDAANRLACACGTEEISTLLEFLR
jgi:hypothetical protein